jgi:hypothetical protein
MFKFPNFSFDTFNSFLMRAAGASLGASQSVFYLLGHLDYLSEAPLTLGTS